MRIKTSISSNINEEQCNRMENERPQVPPPFYGIYNDNDNDDNPRFTKEDMNILHKATFAMIDAIQKKTQDQISPLETRLMAILTSCRRDTGTLSSETDNVFQRAVQLLWNASPSIAEDDNDDGDHDNGDGIETGSTEDVDDMLFTAMQLTEERNQLIEDNNLKIHDVAMDLNAVINAHGFDINEFDV